jgi:uncharacterized YigZ family protein
LKSLSKYKTIKSQSEGVYKEKGSKFIGIAAACYNEDEAKELLDEWKKNHHQARHLCYAYKFGMDDNVYRANDDGEPNNSAGAPILGQIESFGLRNVLIGVVRYYGGTKLGVGGLINAYRTAAKDAIENAKIVELEMFHWVELNFDYMDMPHIMNILKKNDLESMNQVFEVGCKLKTNIPMDSYDFIKGQLEEFDSIKIKYLGNY